MKAFRGCAKALRPLNPVLQRRCLAALAVLVPRDDADEYEAAERAKEGGKNG